MMNKSLKLMTIFSVMAMMLTACGGSKRSNSNSDKDDSISDVPSQSSEDSADSTHTHDWGEATYEWASDYSTCTAQRICKLDATHIESETATASYAVTTAATYDAEGVGRYTATFENKAFATQTHDIVIDKVIYNGQEPIYNDLAKTVINYGLYPQSVVSDNDLLTALNKLDNNAIDEDNGWYLYNGEYYIKETAHPYESTYKFSNNVFISDSSSYWFKCEPISWKVLNNNNGECYLTSFRLLDVVQYHTAKNTKNY